MNGLPGFALPSLISSSVMKRTGSDGAASPVPRIRAERSRPTSGRASVWSMAILASAVRRVDTGETEQSRQQVGVAGRNVDPSRPAFDQRAGDDERHMDGLLVGVVPLLVHAAVGAEQFAVVGGEDHDGVLVSFRGAPAHRARVRYSRRPRPASGSRTCVGARSPAAVRLASPTCRHSSVDRPAWWIDPHGASAPVRDRRDVAGVVAQALRQRKDAKERDVVRVQERADRQPRLIVLLLVEPLQKPNHLVRREHILQRAGIVLPEPVWVRSNPFREAVFVKQIRLAGMPRCFPASASHYRRLTAGSPYRPGRRYAGARHATCPCSRSDNRRRGTSRPSWAPRVGSSQNMSSLSALFAEPVGLGDAVQRRVVPRQITMRGWACRPRT